MVDKHAKQDRNVQKRKRSQQAASLEYRKSGQVVNQPENTFNSRIAWRFGSMDDEGKWACDLDCLQSFRDWFNNYEKLTIREIFHTHNQHRHCHPMPVEKICNEAQARIDNLKIDHERMYQISLGGPVRLWGIMENHIFHIVWFDPDHSVYPMDK